MPNMETQNSNVSRAEEIKVLANEAFKGATTLFFSCFFSFAFWIIIFLI